MARIIPFQRDRHREIQMLLPWYGRGLLPEDERAEVAAHLAGCAGCAAELAAEQTLAAELAGLPTGADDGWSRLSDRLAPPRRRAPASLRIAPVWAAAAALIVAALLGLAGVVGVRGLEAPRYQTLSAPAPREAAAMVVVFRPDATEADLRRVLTQAGARLVDGPTASGAYVLKTPRPHVAQALASLRRQPQVVVAQPLDAGLEAR